MWHLTPTQDALTVQLEYLIIKRPDYSMGQWVIQVSDVDPVAMLMFLRVRA